MGQSMLLELKNIRLKQGHFQLQVPYLHLESGQLYILQGENGSGKSTLLRLMALLQKPAAGLVSFNCKQVSWQAEELTLFRQKISLLEQNPWLFAGSVEKNLAFGLKLRGVGGIELQRTISQTLEMVGLQNFQKRRAKELSGGESRRVALARALCLQPKLLLLDEPTANLDAGQIETLEEILLGLPEQDMTVVFASHDNGQSQRLGGDVIQLKNGQLVDPPARKPALKVV